MWYGIDIDQKVGGVGYDDVGESQVIYTWVE